MKFKDWTYCSKINLQVRVSCSHWLTDPTHIALAEVHRHLALVPELAVHGCPHQQVWQAVLVQINCTQWGAKVRAHLEPSRATEQWVRSQTLRLQFIRLTYDSHSDWIYLPICTHTNIKGVFTQLKSQSCPHFLLFTLYTYLLLFSFGFWQVCSFFKSLSKHLTQT